MPVTHIFQRADVRVCTDQVAGLVLREQLNFVWKFVLLEVIKLFVKVTEMSFLDRDIEIARLQVATDAILLYALANDLVSGSAHFPYQPGNPRAMMFEHDFLAGDAADHLAAVSARCPPPDFVGLDNMNVVTTFCQMQCRRDSGEARAYDAHIRIHGTAKRRKVAYVIDAGGVVRPCVRLGTFHIVVLIVMLLTRQVNEPMILVSSAAVGIQS